jgi:outer membrane protein insertion porin family
MFGLTLSGEDILKHHEYSFGVLYGLKSEDVAYEAEYVNRQFFPTIRLFGYDMPEKYQNLFQNTAGDKESYFERRQGGGIEITTPVLQTWQTTVSLLTGYDYCQFSALTDLETLRDPLPDEGVLSGASAGILFDRFRNFRYPDEKVGQSLLLKYTWYNDALGSDFHFNKFTGALDIRLPMPFLRSHLLRLKAAGGLIDGEIPVQGVFQAGGFLFDAPSTIPEEPQWYLRGYEENAFAGDRVIVGTVEYRMPFWSPQRTIWGGRFFIDSIIGSAFYETGDAWHSDAQDLDLKHGVGGELTLNVGAYYGKYPVSLSVGFARGLDAELGESQIYFKGVMSR